MTSPIAPKDRDGFRIAIICALPVEAESVRAIFDTCWEDEGRYYGKVEGDKNTYTPGVIGRRNVVLVHMPSMGGIPAAQVITNLGYSYPKIEIAFVVGICGVIPVNPATKENIFLGDVVISTAITQYDYGRQHPEGFQRKKAVDDSLRKAPTEIRSFLRKMVMRQSRKKLRANLLQLVESEDFQNDEPTAKYPDMASDCLYKASYVHQHEMPIKCNKCHDGHDIACSLDCIELRCKEEELVVRSQYHATTTPQVQTPGLHPNGGPNVHLGRFGSANTVMRSGLDRDKLAEAEELIAFEMEGAGIWDEYPTIVIKGACDYADSHKNKDFQPYAAMMAAACLRVVLKEWTAAAELTCNTAPIWHVPFERTSEFVGRQYELERIKKKMYSGQGRRIVSILGLGGMGKSRLALELAYHIRSEHPGCSIFWIYAADQFTFEHSMRETGRLLGIPGIDNERVDARDLVKQELSNRESKWVLILDNADDEDLWGRMSKQRSPEKSLVDFLPATTNGSLVVTTRTRSIVTFLTGKEVIELSELPPDQAVQMFISGLENSDLAEPDTTLHLVEQLAFLPLAIVQASSFINQTQQTSSTYLNWLDQPEEHVIELLSQDFEEALGYSSNPKALSPVATTWWVSFQQIRKHHPLAAYYLSWMACLEEKNIALSLLPRNSPIQTTKAIAVLIGYSFVKEQKQQSSLHPGERFYDVHRLVHLCIRNWLRQEGLLDNQTTDCVKQLSELLPQAYYPIKDLWARYLPHIRRLCADKFVERMCERYELLYKTAGYLRIDGKYDEAVKTATTVVMWREQALGASHRATLNAYSDLGDALRMNGDLQSSELFLQKALAFEIPESDNSYSSTLYAKGVLASILSTQGRSEEAAKLGEQIVKDKKKILGPKHASTLTSMIELARSYNDRGRFKEAEALLLTVVETSKISSESDDVVTMHGMNVMAVSLLNQCRLEEAEAFYVELVKISKEFLGPEHPTTLVYMTGFFHLLQLQGRLPEAEENTVELVSKFEKVLGLYHVNTLQCKKTLADIYLKQRRWEEAEKLLVSTIKTSERAVYTSSDVLLMLKSDLAIAIKGQCRLTDAENIELEVLQAHKESFGPNHPDTLIVMHNLANTLMGLDRRDEAIALMSDCVNRRIEILGLDHKYTRESSAILEQWTRSVE